MLTSLLGETSLYARSRVRIALEKEKASCTDTRACVLRSCGSGFGIAAFAFHMQFTVCHDDGCSARVTRFQFGEAQQGYAPLNAGLTGWTNVSEKEAEVGTSALTLVNIACRKS